MTGTSDVLAADWIAAYPPARSLPLDQEVLRIYERAYYIGDQSEGADDPPISFTTVMAALLLGEDDTSCWFAQQAKTIGPDSGKVFDEKSITPKVQQAAIAQSGRPADPHHLSTDKHLLTSSARLVLQNAEAWAQKVGGNDIGVRHLIASYVLNPPPNHRLQMKNWGFKESEWRAMFFAWVPQQYLWEAWTDVSKRPAPTRGLGAFESVQTKGSYLDWPGNADAMKILEQAARTHARREDRWLRLQTVLYALFEIALKDTTVQTAVQPLWDAVQSVQRYDQNTLNTYCIKPISDQTQQALFSTLDISPRVLNALETARQLAEASLVHQSQVSDGGLKVGPLHLAGAMVSRRVDAEQELVDLGLDSQALRIKLISFASQHGESEDVWREMLGEEETLPVGRPVELNSDEPEAVVRLDEDWKLDPLAIRPDVEAFATLLACKTLQPPLSIGLFGPWGSGKTTFLKRLRQAVDRRSSEARQPNGSGTSPYVSNVVHIEFNAWHYSEDALVSSLVDAIFRALSAFIKDEQVVAGKKWCDQKREALESSKRKVQAAQERQTAATAAVNARERDLADKRTASAESLTNWQNVVGAAWNAAKQALLNDKAVKDSRVLDAFGDTVKNTQELQARLNHIRNRPGRMLSDLGWGQSLLLAVMVLAVPPLVGWGVGKILHLGQAGELLSTVTALLSVVGVWARSATGAMAKVDEAITRVADAYDQRVSSAPAVQQAQVQLRMAQSSADTAAAGLEAARSELGQAQMDLANATLPLQMLRVLTSRSEDMSYKKELTTLSLARADLETLSTILRDQGSDGTSSTGTARAVDRIILYIDDLDRCKPEDVVRVLQLTHMLLAFELFVVVVAVDVRWVEQALTNRYRWLDESDDHAMGARPISFKKAPEDEETGGVSVQDYLEKIFQIAFWLEPMTAPRAASYLASLVRNPSLEPTATAMTSQVPPADARPVPPGGKIEITALELDYMRALAAYVGPSPRRVKRLVNAYRLIKARMSDAQLNAFLTDRPAQGDGPYQIVIALLVIGTGSQAEAAQILKELAELDPRGKYESVIQRFEQRKRPDWTVAARVIQTLMRTQRAKNVSELRGWARKVGRFLLHRPIEELHLATPVPMPTPQQDVAAD